MTYQINGSEKVGGYIKALDARLATLSTDDAVTFLEAASDAANKRIDATMSDAARAELDMVLSEIANRYFRRLGWLA
jgi:hypothetical protein